MLRGFDKGLAVVSWIAAAALVIMLFVGPQVVAEDKAEGGGADQGKALFTDNCGSCHTLSRADTDGQIGPTLDDVELSTADVESIVKAGSGQMPSFEGQLSDAEIAAIAAFVTGQDYSAPPN